MRILATVAMLATIPQAGLPQPGTGRASVVLDNARVRVYRADASSLTGIERGPGVVIWIQEQAGDEHARAVWRDDVADTTKGLAGGPLVIVQPRKSGATAAPPKAGSSPGSAPFVGMSFVPLFENAQVSVLRARMDVDAREGFHTHGSDTLVVHLSGGEIEDTADGKTVVNRWKPGDVEFESLGSSHSARNVGRPVDVILVALKP
jgi:quercetin dioxygenase-like cupin family protein